MSKVCTNCLNEKEINEFYIKSGNPQSQCKNCIKDKSNTRRIQNREKNKIYFSEYYKKNKETKKEYDKNYYLNNKESFKERSKNYYLNNKEEQNKKNCDRQKNNREKRNSYLRAYNKNKRIEDPLFKIVNNIRTSIYNSIKRGGYTKNSNTLSILCCTYDEFKLHLENKFEDWMTWYNYGKYNGELNYGWDIDHIIPISSARSEENIIKLNHYTNLQPLCSKINRDIKKDKLKNEDSRI